MRLKKVGELYPELKPILNKFDVDELYPTQSEAIEKGALENSFLLASGTASGKTLVALLAAARKVLEGKKVLYLAPLRSLAFEKFNDFKKLPFRTAISIGDMDSNDHWLEHFDIIVATYEKAESLIRHRPPWLKRIGLVVFDEAHEMARKPIIETLAVKLGWSQLLVLSATIGNVPEIARWLGVPYLESNFRPVPLKEGVLDGTKILWKTGDEKIEASKRDIEGIIEDGIARKRQTLIFTNTRREAEATAEKAARIINVNKEELSVIADQVEKALDFPTRQCKKLAGIIRRGSAFHHAGLVNEQRILVENAFRARIIPVLASTVTLVAGINLPSRRVVIKNPNFRGEPWPVSLYRQAAGRSGRPGYDKEGEAIIVHRRPGFAKELYIDGDVEEVTSPLAYEPTLRREIIGLFASGFASSKKNVEDFMRRSFYAFHHGNSDRIIWMGNGVVDKLISWKMLKGDDHIVATKLGKRVAELYIDPYTAMLWLSNFSSTSLLGYVHLVGMSNEMFLPRLRAAEKEEFAYSLASRGDELVFPRPQPWDIDFEHYVKSLKLSMIIEDWAEEKSEDYVLNRFGIAPGDLRGYIRNTEWLTHALEEIVKVTKGAKSDLSRATKRIKHGVRQELVGLAELPGIGRVKARRLYKEGISEKTIAGVPKKKLEELVGKGVASKILQKKG